MKTLFTILCFISSIAFCQGQKLTAALDGISMITLVVQQSRRPRYHEVSINISLQEFGAEVSVKSKAACYDRKCLKTNIDTVYRISKDAFLRVENAVTKISSSDIKTAQVQGKDGMISVIGFRQNIVSVAHAVWAPNYRAKERNLEAYLQACKLILQAAKLKERDIL